MLTCGLSIASFVRSLIFAIVSARQQTKSHQHTIQRLTRTSNPRFRLNPNSFTVHTWRVRSPFVPRHFSFIGICYSLPPQSLARIDTTGTTTARPCAISKTQLDLQPFRQLLLEPHTRQHHAGGSAAETQLRLRPTRYSKITPRTALASEPLRCAPYPQSAAFHCHQSLRRREGPQSSRLRGAQSACARQSCNSCARCRHCVPRLESVAGAGRARSEASKAK